MSDRAAKRARRAKRKAKAAARPRTPESLERADLRQKQYRGEACVVCGVDKHEDGGGVDLYGDIHAARLVDFTTELPFVCDEHDDEEISAGIERLARREPRHL